MTANIMEVTIKKTTHTNMRVVYNLSYNGHKYKLNFYQDGDDEGWFVSCFAVDGVLIGGDHGEGLMCLFYEEGDTELCNYEKLKDLIDCIFSLAVKGVLHIAVYPEI